MLEPNNNCQCIIVNSHLSDAEKVFICLSQYIQQHNISSHTQDDLRLALEETFINIVSYAYSDITNTDTKNSDKHTQEIKVEFSHTCDTINITFIDTGKAFNPLTDAEQFDENNEHIEGGMGIHLIKSLTDAQVYKRTKQTNVFTLTKHYTNWKHQ